jgi:TusA-related sulfurtransferase
MAIDAAGPPARRADEDRSGEPGREAALRLVDAVAARDFNRMVASFAVDATIRYLVPRGPRQITGAPEIAAKFLDWFGDGDPIEVQEILVQPVSDRTSVRYRFLLREEGAWKIVEQQTYLDVDDEGRIRAIDLLCSGFRPADDPAKSGRTHGFDAGQMGCSDGLAPEFRRRIGAIPLGDVLAVTVRDPAAKEDLPALARLMGHKVGSVQNVGDGRLTITVEKTR